jgi:cytochrome c biogenesis protein CcmG/thiol:disulfide interchange protein DsbE
MRALKVAGLLLAGIALGAGVGAALWFDPGDSAAFTPGPGSTMDRTPLNAAPAPVLDAPAPVFSLADLDGRSVSLADLRGTAVIVNFWATWCAPCREELPLLDGIAGRHTGALSILAVETGEPENEVRNYLEPLGLASLTVLLDPSSVARDQYLVRGLPTTFFIDSEGIIRRIKIGTLDSAEIESILPNLGVSP